ncbi:unnamed protein product [Gadus morhua 'NCC']
MIKERQRKIKDIIDTVDHSKADADREIADGVQVLTALRRSVEKCLDDHNKTVQEKLKSTEIEAEGLIKELEQEIKDLTNRSSEVKQFTQTEDHLHLLQTFRSLKDPPPTRDWTTVEVRPPSYVGTLRRALDQLEETLNMEVKKVPDLRSVPHKYACDLTLDPNTAGRRLSLSEDNRKVTWVREDQSYPDHPDRFDSLPQVLGREALTGRCYWEVEVGVYLDRPAGSLSFYRVSPGGGGSSDTLTHLHTFWSSFTQEDLLPGVGVGGGGGGVLSLSVSVVEKNKRTSSLSACTPGARLAAAWEEVPNMTGLLKEKEITTVQELLQLAGAQVDNAENVAGKTGSPIHTCGGT